MEIDLTDLENEVKEFARDTLNKVGKAANDAAISHVKSTYNTQVNRKNIKTTLATTSNLTFKISVKSGSVSLIKRVTRISRQGATVLIKKGSPKSIKRAFAAPWQKGQAKRWLFLRRGRLRRSLYTIGLVGMFKSRGTMNAIAASINKTLGKFK